MVFKKIKLKKKQKAEIRKKEPVFKELKVFDKYNQKKDDLDIIISLLYSRFNNGLRKIMDLPDIEISQNVLILTRKILEIELENNFTSKLTFKVLHKLISANKECLYELLWEYLYVSIVCNRDYSGLLNFCIKNCSEMIYNKKCSLMNILDDEELKCKVASVRKVVSKSDFNDKVVLVKNKFVRI